MEERVSLLAQQVTNMMADVTTLQSELAGSGAQFAELMVRLVTNDPRIRKIVDTSEEREPTSSRGYKLLRQGSPIQRLSAP